MIDVVSYLNNGLSTTPETKEAQKDLGKDAFMQLLISQMTYQNPLEPMENTEFIAQLAQFSALEQQQNIAAGIEMLALTQTAATNSQMVNLIGKRVVVPGSEFSLDGEKPVTLRFDLQGEASPSEMIIRNSNGDVVRRISITDFIQGANELQFDGMDEDGNLLESGNYTFDIAMANDEGNENLATYSNLLVDAVSFDGTSILLKSDGTTIDLGDISEVISNQGG
jgi:flagellar basal-body rod modification protein FlgD